MSIPKYKKFQNKSSVVHHISELEVLLAEPERATRKTKKIPKKSKKLIQKSKLIANTNYLKHKYVLKIFNSIFILKLYIKISI